MRHTANTIASGNELRLELRNVRRDGFAYADQEQELDVRAVAVPLFDRTGRVIASLGLAGSLSQIHEDNMNALVQAARRTARVIANNSV